MRLIGPGDINGVIADIYDGVYRLPIATFKDQTLARLKDAIPFDSAIWGSGAQNPQLIFGIATYAFPLDRLIAYSTHWQDHDALRNAVAAQPGHCLRNEDLGPIADYHASAIYLGFCRPAGIEHALGITIVDAITNVGELIFLFRSRSGAFYSDQERDAMAQFMPHVVSAWRHRQLLHFRERAKNRDDENASLPAGYAVIDDLGQVHASDPAFGLGMRRHFPGWIGPALPAALLPVLANGAAQYEVDGQHFAIARGTDRHILSLVKEADCLPITPAEHRVAVLYAEGKTASDVASSLRLSPMTVRNHLTSIYAKLGIHSKVELARWLAMRD